MIVQQKTIYRCDHCKKLYLVKHACERHENICWQNPKNHYACFDCLFLEKGRHTIDSGADYGISVRTFVCTKLDKEMHTVIAVARKLQCVDNTELMPLQCEHRKDYVDQYFENNDD